MNQLLGGNLELSQQESELLLWQVPNEILNCFKVNDFEGMIGIGKEEAQLMFHGLGSGLKNEQACLRNLCTSFSSTGSLINLIGVR